MKCLCGYDFRRVQPRGKSNRASWERFAVYSAEALWCENDIQRHEIFSNFLDSRLTEHEIHNKNDSLDYLSTIYGTSESRRLLSNVTPRIDDLRRSKNNPISRYEFRAPHMCAFLAAIDDSFIKTNELFIEFQQKNSAEMEHLEASDPYPEKLKIPKTVSDAREMTLTVEADAGKKKTRSFIYHKYKTLFWYLTLFDQNWFDLNYPPGNRGGTKNIPTIEADRREIREAMYAAKTITVREWKNLAQQAFFRALLRDPDWLNGRKEETLTERKRVESLRTQRQIEAYRHDIAQAIGRIREINGDDAEISLKTISVYTGRSQRPSATLV